MTRVRAGWDALLGRRGAAQQVAGWGLVLALTGLTTVIVVLLRFGFVSGVLQLGSWAVLLCALGLGPGLALATIVVLRPPRWLSAVALTVGILAAVGFGYAWWGFGVGFDAAENNTAAPPLSDHWFYGGFAFVLGTALLTLTLAVGGLVSGRQAARQQDVR